MDGDASVSGRRLKTEVQTYFRLFYHCELSDGDYEELVRNSIGVQQEALSPAA